MKFVVCALFAVALVPATLADDEKPASVWNLIRDYASHGVEPSPHIINGIEAKPNSYQHMALLSMSGSIMCGGSLIHPEWLLTAAHCVNNAQSAIAVLGAHTRANNAEPTRQTIKAAKIFVEDKIYADIALLKLEKPATINQFVKPIRLPSRSMQGKQLGGTPAEMTGWGRFTNPDSGVSSVLRVAPTILLNNDDCKNRGLGAVLRDFHICSEGLNGRGPCSGDSGGPLFITEPDGQRTLVGVAAFVEASCNTRFPGAFTRVGYWLDWINKVTGIPIRP